MADDETALPAAPAATTAGAMLAHAREAAALSVDAVAAQLKLAPRQVRALESGDFAALPGRTFVRGFVRNYARLLDIDAERVLTALPGADDDPGLSHPHLANTHRVMGEIPAEHARRRSFAGWAIALALMAIIAVAVLYEMMRQQWHPLAPTKAAQPPASAPAATPAEPAQPEGRVLSNPVAPGDAADVPAPRASAASVPDAAMAPEAPGSPSPSAASAPALQSDTAASKPQVAALLLPPAARTLSDATPANAGVAPATAKATTLQVIFRGKSWIDVKDAQGASVLTMTGNDGATRTLDASPPLDVVVGNADHVDVIFRGQHIDLAAHAKQNVARLQLR